MSEFFTTNAHNSLHWTPNSYFGNFGTISLLHEFRCKTGRIGASEFFAMNASDPHHWTQTHVSGHFEPFLYYTNFVAKWAEPVLLMYKFVQRCQVKFFRNDLTRYTPLDPRLMFWGVSDHSVIARTSVQNGPNWCH
jgi:hypothetical protein